MVEDIIEICADFQLLGLAETEVLVHPKIHAPRAWANEKVAFRNGRIIKEIRTCRWQTEGGGVEKLSSHQIGMRIASNGWAERWPVKVAHRVDEPAADVTWKNRVAVIAGPK